MDNDREKLWWETLKTLTLSFLAVIAFSIAITDFESRFLPADEARRVILLEAEPLRSITSVSESLANGFLGDFAYAAELMPGSPVLDEGTIAPIAEFSVVPRVLGETVEAPLYAAEFVAVSNPILTLPPGTSVTVWADFKNTGTATWTKSGKHFTALNVAEPAGRKSSFRHKFWNEYPYRPARLLKDSVAPGETGRVRFALKAPPTIARGTYSETFGLVAENLQWIPGGTATITIVVPEDYVARFQEASQTELTLEPGQEKTVTVDFKNFGAKVWTNKGSGLVALAVAEPIDRESQFFHRFWRSRILPAWLYQNLVRHGEVGRFRFALKAPLTEGTYLERFSVATPDGQAVVGGSFALAIVVARQPVVLPGITGPGPTMRIGLYWKNAPVTVTADGAWSATDGAGTTLRTLAPTETATVTFDASTKTYMLSVGTETFTAPSPIRLVPSSDSVILSVESYEDPLGWWPTNPAKRYRGTIETRWAEATQRLWIINELPLESYLAGIAEAGNENPEHYLKALMIAARSYAIYHFGRGTKHADEHFTLDATYDQVYRGYNAELARPNVVKAASDTRGEAVTYAGRVVIAPYFSHSDGRTRSWEEVWAGGPYVWLVSVPDPCCTGMDLFGHGVGMSAQGALYFANLGKTYDEILKYYYTGIGIQAVY